MHRLLIRQPGKDSRALDGTETGAGSEKRPVRTPSRTTRTCPHSRPSRGTPIAQRPLRGRHVRAVRGPVSRASTLRSAVPETLPDGTQHWDGYLRLIADAT